MKIVKFHSINRRKEFEKDFKKLLKRFKSLENDLQTFLNTQLILFHKHKIDNHGTYRIPNLGFEEPQIYKAKKFACKALKGKGARSGIRIIYAYFQSKDNIELIEIYYKEKDNTKENKKRIKDLYAK